MSIKVTSLFYSNIGKELSSFGIYIKPKDVFILVKIILKNISSVLTSDKQEICVDRSASLRRNGHNNIVLKCNDRLQKIPRRLDMTDESSQRILENIFLPMFEKENRR